MKTPAVIIAAALLAGCVPTPDTEGQIVSLTERTVTIRGAYDMSLSGKPASPTPAMVAQAQEVCPGARYLSATPSPTDDYTFHYLFQCK